MYKQKRQIQACSAGHRDKRQRLAGGGVGKRPGGFRSAPREEMCSG